jgi:hypothetical protein
MKTFRICTLALLSLATMAFCEYKNVALNTADVRAAGKGYPHASSNSEYPCIWTNGTSGCAPDTTFLALNAIDGKTKNDCHGSLACASWGPQLTVPGLWWRVNFGNECEVDTVVIWIRHDFPHDSWWKDATLVFSDSSKVAIHPDSVSRSQKFGFTKRKTTSMTITSLVAKDSTKWCAFTEVQVWGSPSIITNTVSDLHNAHPTLSPTGNFLVNTLQNNPGNFTIPPLSRCFSVYSVNGRCLLQHSGNIVTKQSIQSKLETLPKGVYNIQF